MKSLGEIILVSQDPCAALPLLEERAQVIHVTDVAALLAHLDARVNQHVPRRLVIVLTERDADLACSILRELKAHAKFSGLPVAVICAADSAMVRRLYELHACCVVQWDASSVASVIEALSSFWLQTAELPTCD